ASTLLMTNHHVFPTRGDAAGMGANFLFERDERGLRLGVIFEIDPDGFYLSDEALDYAIVAVKPVSIDRRRLEEFAPIALIEAVPKILIGQPVNIIEYPEGGPKQYATTHNQLVDILDEGFLHYETDTLEGSSGSPAFSGNWELVALHHSSIPEIRDGHVIATDGSIWTEEMDDDRVHWVANEGVRVSAIVKSLGRQRLPDPKQQALLRALMASTTDPVDEIARTAPGSIAGIELSTQRPEAAAGGQAMPGNQFTFTGPVTIHVYAPVPVPMALPPAPAAAALPEAVEKVIRFDTDYDDREGYNEAFLDPDHRRVIVPLPEISPQRSGQMLTDSNGRTRILKYHHFSLAMNRRRRL